MWTKKNPVEEKFQKAVFIEFMNILNELETVQNNLVSLSSLMEKSIYQNAHKHTSGYRAS